MILSIPNHVIFFLQRIQSLPGYIAYNFVLGAYSYWGPKAGYSIYHMVLLYVSFNNFIILNILRTYYRKALIQIVFLFKIGTLNGVDLSI
jgi:hypothetical protein